MWEISRTFHEILSVPQNIVMRMKNVMAGHACKQELGLELDLQPLPCFQQTFHMRIFESLLKL